MQARPITTLPADLNEFDTTLPRPDDVLTISNVSEMMPGAVCPLTMSFTGSGIDYGLQHMQATVGARAGIDERWQITASAYGHLFLNLTGNVVLSAGVLGSSADQAAQTLCGRVVPELARPPTPAAPAPRGELGHGSFATASRPPGSWSGSAASSTASPSPSGPTAPPPGTRSRATRWFFDHAMAVHIQSSALSGFLNAIVENIVSAESNASTVEEQAETVRLLAGASGVESAVMLDELDDLVDLVARHPDAAHEFQGVPVEDRDHLAARHPGARRTASRPSWPATATAAIASCACATRRGATTRRRSSRACKRRCTPGW